MSYGLETLKGINNKFKRSYKYVESLLIYIYEHMIYVPANELTFKIQNDLQSK